MKSFLAPLIRLLFCLSVRADPPAYLEPYAKLLARHVDARGRVDYPALAADPAPLRDIAVALAGTDPNILADATEAERFAFWINAYNALTLQLIVDHWPIAATHTNAPPESIRQIPEAWSAPRFVVAGRQLSLDAIEHEILRKEIGNPLLHFGLVCASRGCPPLPHEPFRAADVIPRLQAQARAFLASPENLRYDEETKTLFLSPIFDWFREDFAGPYGKPLAKGFDQASSGLLHFARTYGPESLRSKMAEARAIRFLDYDWRLNRQP
jgi:hypothetical protein